METLISAVLSGAFGALVGRMLAGVSLRAILGSAKSVIYAMGRWLQKLADAGGSHLGNIVQTIDSLRNTRDRLEHQMNDISARWVQVSEDLETAIKQAELRLQALRQARDDRQG